MINTDRLQIELKNKNIEISGCNSNGIVWDLDGNEIQDREDVATVIENHNPNKVTLEEITARRNTLLQESDWTQLPDAPLTEEKKQEWVVYRQALRDITEVVIDFNNVVFPDKPEDI